MPWTFFVRCRSCRQLIAVPADGTSPLPSVAAQKALRSPVECGSCQALDTFGSADIERIEGHNGVDPSRLESDVMARNGNRVFGDPRTRAAIQALLFRSEWVSAKCRLRLAAHPVESRTYEVFLRQQSEWRALMQEHGAERAALEQLAERLKRNMG